MKPIIKFTASVMASALFSSAAFAQCSADLQCQGGYPPNGGADTPQKACYVLAENTCGANGYSIGDPGYQQCFDTEYDSCIKQSSRNDAVGKRYNGDAGKLYNVNYLILKSAIAPKISRIPTANKYLTPNLAQ